MLPGAICAGGFLGQDTRPLKAILDADGRTVRRLGLTHARIAARMRELRDAAGRGLGDPVAVGPHLEATVDSNRGGLPCPFGDAGLSRKTNTRVHNTATGGEIVFSDLNIHLIEAHGFYEGFGAPFRSDPERLVAILKIAPETLPATGRKRRPAP